jgi:hypothetical protein
MGFLILCGVGIGKTLEERQFAEFNPEDSRSLELKFCSKLLLPS